MTDKAKSKTAAASAGPAQKTLPADSPDNQEGVTQDAPTQEPKRDRYGYQIDDFGLPVNGPVRTHVLIELADAGFEKTGPHDTERDFTKTDVKNVMEKYYG